MKNDAATSHVPEATTRVPFTSWDHPSPTVRLLIADVYKGLEPLKTIDDVRMPDGSPITDAVRMDRARNIVAGLIGNFSFASLDAKPRENLGPVENSRRSAREFAGLT